MTLKLVDWKAEDNSLLRDLATYKAIDDYLSEFLAKLRGEKTRRNIRLNMTSCIVTMVYDYAIVADGEIMPQADYILSKIHEMGKRRMIMCSDMEIEAVYNPGGCYLHITL